MQFLDQGLRQCFSKWESGRRRVKSRGGGARNTERVGDGAPGGSNVFTSEQLTKSVQ